MVVKSFAMCAKFSLCEIANFFFLKFFFFFEKRKKKKCFFERRFFLRDNFFNKNKFFKIKIMK